MVVQASQVYFETYPTVKKTTGEWLVVCQIKVPVVIDVPSIVEKPHTLNDLAFKEDNSQIHEIDIYEDETPHILNDLDSVLINIEDEEEEGGKRRRRKGRRKEEEKDDDNDNQEQTKEEEEEEEYERQKKRRKSTN